MRRKGDRGVLSGGMGVGVGDGSDCDWAALLLVVSVIACSSLAAAVAC